MLSLSKISQAFTHPRLGESNTQVGAENFESQELACKILDYVTVISQDTNTNQRNQLHALVVGKITIAIFKVQENVKES